MIKIRDLEYLDAIERYRHFGKAADACCVSQPTLSGQIIKLETQLNLQLIERHRRNVMLTPAGEQLVKDARSVLKAASDFEDSAKALLDPLAGDVHIGLIPTLAPYLLPHVMPALNKRLPKISFYLHENKTQVLLEELDQGKLDMILLPWLEEMENFERYELFEEPLVLAVHTSHSLSMREQVKLSDINSQPVLTLEDGHCLREQALGYCFSAGANEDPRFKATSLETLRYMVASGLGITLLPKLATVNGAQSDTICYVPFISPQPTRQVSLVIRPNYSGMACVREVVSCIRESVVDIFC